MNWRDKRPLKPFEWGFLVLLLAVLLYVAASLWGVVAGGLPNLGRALADGEIRFAVGLSLWTATLSTLLCILIGIPCAYLLAFTPLPGKRWAEALLELPLALPYLVLGLCLLTLFSSPFGKALKELGLRLVFDPKGIVAVHLLINLPFVIHLAAQAFRQIDPELPLTAQTLGATRLQAFRYITLPLCRPALLSAFLLAWSRGMGDVRRHFDAGGSHPAENRDPARQHLPQYLHRRQRHGAGGGSAAASALPGGPGGEPSGRTKRKGSVTWTGIPCTRRSAPPWPPPWKSTASPARR